MKKSTILGMFLGIVMVVAPNMAHALSTEVTPSSTDSCTNVSVNLYYGMNDVQTAHQVSVLQEFLHDNNYLEAKPNGYFGVGTLAGIKKFQKENGLPSVGVVGPMTRTKINELGCNHADTHTSTTNTSPVATVNSSSAASSISSLLSGCTSKTGYSITTGNPCDGSAKVITKPTVLASASNTSSVVRRSSGGGGGGSSRPKSQPQVLTSVSSQPAVVPEVVKPAEISKPAIVTGLPQSQIQEQTQIQEEQIETTVENTTGCTATSAPFITITSPNGAEVFSDGQQSTLTWTSCNLSVTSIIPFYLEVYDSNNTHLGHIGLGSSVNDGEQAFTLPLINVLKHESQFSNIVAGNHFKISLVGTDDINALTQTDYSDEFFSIAEPLALCAIESFTANPLTVEYGGTTQLSYGTNQVCRRFTLPELNYSSLGVGGYQQVGPLTETKTYTMKASSDEGCSGSIFSATTGQFCTYAIQTVTVTVLPSVNEVSTCSATSTPSITITSPNGGELFNREQLIPVTWTSCNLPADALITAQIENLTIPTGTTIFPVNMITTGDAIGMTENDGMESFALPSMQSPLSSVYGNNSENFKVLLSVHYNIDGHYNNAGMFPYDMSDNTFTVAIPTIISTNTCSATSAPSITLTSPNGGQIYTAGQLVHVTWTTCNVPNGTEILIYLKHINTTANTTGWSMNLLSGSGLTQDDGSEDVYLLPESLILTNNGQLGQNFEIVVSAQEPSGNAIDDESDSLITVNTSMTTTVTTCPTNTTPSITLTSLNGGQALASNGQFHLTWSSCNAPANSTIEAYLYKEHLSGTNGDMSYGLVPVEGLWYHVPVTNNEGTFTLPNFPNFEPGSDFKIKILIAPNNQGAVTDFSDDYITVVNPATVSACSPTDAPSITVTSPNGGGESFMREGQIPVTWISCNLPADSLITAQLNNVETGEGAGALNPVNMIVTNGGAIMTADDGTEAFTLPSLQGPLTNAYGNYGKNFKLLLSVHYNINGHYNNAGMFPYDMSDDTFTINQATVSAAIAGCTGTTPFSPMTGVACPGVAQVTGLTQEAIDALCTATTLFNSVTSQPCPIVTQTVTTTSTETTIPPQSIIPIINIVVEDVIIPVDYEQQIYNQAINYTPKEGLLDAACPLGYDGPNMQCKKAEGELKTTDCLDGTNSYRPNGECNEAYNPKLNEPDMTASNDPRIMFWQGKVNQHWDQDAHRFETDPDGVSGNTTHAVAYCNQIYSTNKFTRIEPYKEEVSKNFSQAENINNWMYAFMSYKCVE